MKVMKKYILATALIFGAVHFVGAQEGKEYRGKKMKAVHAEKLNLSEEQKAKMETIRQDYRKKSQVLHEEKRLEMKKILTPEQFKQMESMKKEGHKRQAYKKRHYGEKDLVKKEYQRKTHEAYRKGSPEEHTKQRIERLDKQLSLTDKQKTQLEKIGNEYAVKQQELMKKETAEREERRAEMKKLREAQQKEEAKVLTKEQVKKLEEFRSERKKNSKERRNNF